MKVGAVMSKKTGGFVMKLDAIPTSVIDKDGNTVAFNGWISMFESKPKEGQAQQTANQSSQQDDNARFDDIPF